MTLGDWVIVWVIFNVGLGVLFWRRTSRARSARRFENENT
jgi:hypothetical protein